MSLFQQASKGKAQTERTLFCALEYLERALQNTSAPEKKSLLLGCFSSLSREPPQSDHDAGQNSLAVLHGAAAQPQSFSAPPKIIELVSLRAFRPSAQSGAGSRQLFGGRKHLFQQEHTFASRQPAQEDEPTRKEAHCSDSRPQASSHLENLLPAAWLPYAYTMRLDKPIGTWLLAWPCFWSIALAAPQGALPDPALLALFGSGALLLRGAGCTVNDLWDRDLDAKVERTRTRPLASGTLSPFQGLCLLAGQLSLGLGILLQLNEASIWLGAASLGLVVTYPLMKRITFWPQAYLGLTFNWGALLGYTAAQGACEWPIALPLYAGGVCWTLVYDTIYAHQDISDDVQAGVKSTALRFGAATRPWLTGFAASATGLWVTSGAMAGLGLPFHMGVAAAGGHMLWQIWTVDLASRADCMAKFVSNKWLGSLMFAGIVVDHLS